MGAAARLRLRQAPTGYCNESARPWRSPRIVGAKAGDFHETLFILAFACDLSRAHRAQSQGPRAGRVVEVNLLKGAQREAAYRAVNPIMALPALIDGEGPILFESLAIIEYLDETHPNPPLLPRDARGRARARGLA
jgi:hypothetical protein